MIMEERFDQYLRTVFLIPFHNIYDNRSWARLASLIGTCKLNGVEPFAYMKATLEAIAAGHPQSRIDELLPWNFPATAEAAA